MICSRSSSLCLAVCFVAASVISISAASTSSSSSSSSPTETTKDNIDRNSNSVAAPVTTPHNDDNELSYTNMLSNLTYHGGFVAAGVLALSALAALVMPMFGLRFCSLIGSCDSYPATNYASGYANDAAYAGYGQTMYSPSSYQKRSIEYIGPILKALSSAYDKYGKASAVASAKKSS